MSEDILVIIEHKEKRIKNISLEILSFSSHLVRKRGGAVKAVLYGTDLSPQIIEEVGKCGVGEIVTLENNHFCLDKPGYAVANLIDLIIRLKPSMVLIGNTALGKDLTPSLAQFFSAEMISDVVQIDESGNHLKLIRTIYGGKLLEYHNRSDNKLLFVSIRPNTLGIYPCPYRVPQVTIFRQEISHIISYVVKDIASKNQRIVPLTEAEIIVCGGRGIRKKEDFRILEELSTVLGASMGFSRPVIDAGFQPRSLQVGQTGKTVSPRMIILCGISGQIQFLAGISTARHIIAINHDPKATIFNAAHYGIVGDLYQIVPLLTKEFKKILNH